MRIGIIGAGRIAGNAGRLFARAGHEVLLSYARDPATLAARAADIGAKAGSPAEAAAFGGVVMLSLPWDRIDEVAAEPPQPNWPTGSRNRPAEPARPGDPGHPYCGIGDDFGR